MAKDLQAMKSKLRDWVYARSRASFKQPVNPDMEFMKNLLETGPTLDFEAKTEKSDV